MVLGFWNMVERNDNGTQDSRDTDVEGDDDDTTPDEDDLETQRLFSLPFQQPPPNLLHATILFPQFLSVPVKIRHLPSSFLSLLLRKELETLE
jgi:hypothetical protein